MPTIYSLLVSFLKTHFSGLWKYKYNMTMMMMINFTYSNHANITS